MIQQSPTHTSMMSSTHQLALSVWDESPYTLSHEGKRCQRIHTQQILFPLYRMSPNSSYATKHQLAGEKQEIFFPLIIDHLRLLSWSTRVWKSRNSNFVVRVYNDNNRHSWLSEWVSRELIQFTGFQFDSKAVFVGQNDTILTLNSDSIQWPIIIVKFSKEFWVQNVTVVIYHDKNPSGYNIIIGYPNKGKCCQHYWKTIQVAEDIDPVTAI